MPYNDLYLGESGGFEIKLSAFSRKFNEGEIEKARVRDTASFRTVKDIIGKKKIFTLDYQLIDESDLNEILAIFNLQTEMTLGIRRFEDFVEEFIVIGEPFDRDRILSTGGGMWGNVSFTLRQVGTV